MSEGGPSQAGNEATESPARWLMAAALPWAVAALLSYLTPFLALSLGASERTVSLVLRMPRSLILGALVATVQCWVLPAVRPWARRWILAATAGGAIASGIGISLGLLSLPLPFVVGFSGLLGAFVSIPQRWSMRGRVAVPVWFVVASFLAYGITAGVAMLLALRGLAGIR